MMSSSPTMPTAHDTVATVASMSWSIHARSHCSPEVVVLHGSSVFATVNVVVVVAAAVVVFSISVVCALTS